VGEAHDRRQPAVVLAVSDDPAALELLARVVERAGGRAARAVDVDDAVEQASVGLPRAVVVDLRQGVGSALELVDRLRGHEDERVATARLVVVDDAGNGRTVLAAGADVHLSRPAHVRDVADALALGAATS